MADPANATQQIDAYIAALDPPFREALTHLRATILAAAPEAQEIITYAMPGIGSNGAVVSYSAFKTHCSLFPMGASVLEDMRDAVAPYRTSKGTLQFAPDRPMPDALVTQVVRARIAENAERAVARKSRRKTP